MSALRYVPETCFQCNRKVALSAQHDDPVAQYATDDLRRAYIVLREWSRERVDRVMVVIMEICKVAIATLFTTALMLGFQDITPLHILTCATFAFFYYAANKVVKNHQNEIEAWCNENLKFFVPAIAMELDIVRIFDGELGEMSAADGLECCPPDKALEVTKDVNWHLRPRSVAVVRFYESHGLTGVNFDESKPKLCVSGIDTGKLLSVVRYSMPERLATKRSSK